MCWCWYGAVLLLAMHSGVQCTLEAKVSPAQNMYDHRVIQQQYTSQA